MMTTWLKGKLPFRLFSKILLAEWLGGIFDKTGISMSSDGKLWNMK